MMLVRRTLALALVAMALGLGSVAQASSTADFDAVALRPAADGTYPLVAELPTGNGMDAVTALPGQKCVYGTTAFNGLALSSIAKIEYSYYTYKVLAAGGFAAGNPAYTNFAVQSGDGSFYGVLSGSAAATTAAGGGYADLAYSLLPGFVQDEIDNVVQDQYAIKAKHVTVNLAGATNLQFYEPSTTSCPLKHGEYADFASYGFVLTGSRPMSVTTPEKTGEVDEGLWRGPYEQGVSIIWGDSAANYLGNALIWDVTITLTDGTVVTAGPAVPEPMTMLAVGAGIAGLGGYIRRRKRA